MQWLSKALSNELRALSCEAKLETRRPEHGSRVLGQAVRSNPPANGPGQHCSSSGVWGKAPSTKSFDAL